MHGWRSWGSPDRARGRRVWRRGSCGGGVVGRAGKRGQLWGKEAAGRCRFRGGDNSQVRTEPPWVTEASHHEASFHPFPCGPGSGGREVIVLRLPLSGWGGRGERSWGPIVPTQRGSDKSVVCSLWCQWERLPPRPTPCRVGDQMMRGLGSPVAAEDGLGLAPESQKRH